ncbi:TPA: hypothetical protein ENS27_15995 [bacterium]|nr:hypothetical protein [bacterium]
MENNEYSTPDYINTIFNSFVELKGDRKSGDDNTVKAGLGRINNEKFVVIEYKSNKESNHFGLPNSDGYRKSLRLMDMAETFDKPVIIITDITEFHVLSAPYQQKNDEFLAKVQEKMVNLRVPIIAIIAGTYNSFFSLELCAVDRILIFDHSIFMFPFHQTSDFAEPSQLEIKQIKAQELLNLNIVDKIIFSSIDGDLNQISNKLRKDIQGEFQQIKQLDSKSLIEQRLNKIQARFLGYKKMMSEI